MIKYKAMGSFSGAVEGLLRKKFYSSKMFAFLYESDVISLKFKSYTIITLQTWLIQRFQFSNWNNLCVDEKIKVTLALISSWCVHMLQRYQIQTFFNAGANDRGKLYQCFCESWAHRFSFLYLLFSNGRRRRFRCGSFSGGFLLPWYKIKTELRIFRPGTWLKICHVRWLHRVIIYGVARASVMFWTLFSHSFLHPVL